MPIWINERSDGQDEYECSCDCCGRMGPACASSEEASQDFCPTQSQNPDGVPAGEVEYLCSVCIAMIEEGRSDDITVVVARIVAILQLQGQGLSFQPGTDAREMVERLVRGATAGPRASSRPNRLDLICAMAEEG